ncbi:hypothetical protein LZ554_000680 [Drepanopeziza brunnea f. sp. 'monogermtubi']|nr:hypothetical protein LZ554_000680 [Drepanopeziza brunnea f. sp. 'monogermtubi']
MLPTTFIALAAGLVALATAHMEMKFPIPLGDRRGLAGPADYSLHAPLMANGADFPCKGKLGILATPAGASLHTWAAGSVADVTIGGVIKPGSGEVPAFHNGGSCQAALSYDQGKTWKVVHSFQGNCPLQPDTSFKFKIPSDAPTAHAVFAWLWFNHTGNREMYMQCASITIAAGSSSGPAPAVPFAQRPDIFRANIDNGCHTIEGKDTFFPSPGPDVTTVGTKQDGSYSGNCGVALEAVSAVSSSTAPAPAPGPASTASTSSTTKLASSATSNSPPTSAPVNNPSLLRVSTNGECSGVQTCKGSTFGRCCSTWGYCGNTPEHCGLRCMSAFGDCDAHVLVTREWMS